MTSCMMQNNHEIREYVWLYDRIDIMAKAGQKN